MVSQCVTAAPEATDLRAAHALIEQCTQDARDDLRGVEALQADCPRIDAAATDLRLDPLLPRDWKSHVSARALGDLDALAERYAVAAPQPAPNAARLRAIAQALQPPAQPLSWWQRLRAWLAQWLESRSTAWPDWLRPHWSLSAGFWTALAYVLAAILVLAAVVVVIIEVRAARVPGGRRRRGAPRQEATGAGRSEDLWPELSAIEAAAVRERAVLVLRLLVGALTRSQRLDRDRYLTCRELITAARFDSSTQREQFQGLALRAERALYDDPHASPPTSATSAAGSADLGDVKTLYEALLSMPGGAQPGRA